MNTVLKSTILLMGTLAFFTGPAIAGGHTATQMEEAGFTCFPAGPIITNWTHCLDLDKFGTPVVPVKVFSEDGIEFLGTELLLREDIYSGQPCPQDDLDLWDPDAVPGYYACHHFSTGHH